MTAVASLATTPALFWVSATLRPGDGLESIRRARDGRVFAPPTRLAEFYGL